ncbi:MAG TPA: SRPBCC family protein, partial [Acidimicrobiales bacterium]
MSDVQVSTTIGAPPDAVHAIVSDVTRMGEWSPECVRCEWKDAARTRFKGYNRRGIRRWSTSSVVVA